MRKPISEPQPGSQNASRLSSAVTPSGAAAAGTRGLRASCLAVELREQILSGAYPAGTDLPGIKAMGVARRLSSSTVHRAYRCFANGVSSTERPTSEHGLQWPQFGAQAEPRSDPDPHPVAEP